MVLSAFACSEEAVADPVEHALEIQEWQNQRHSELMATDGWLTLVDLYWLDDGATSFGSDPSNTWQFASPDAAPRLGTFHLSEGLVAWQSAPGVEVTTVGGEAAVSYAAMNPADASPLVLETWPLQWLVLRSGERLGIQLKHAESDLRTQFQGLEHFPIVTEWQRPASFVASESAPLQLHTTHESAEVVESIGHVTFEIDDQAQTLTVWRSAEDSTGMFTAFSDNTNGTSSHAGGRYLWIDAPDEEGQTWVDFNKAYNPPCAFTEFAVCVLPPAENALVMAITAGELVYGDGR